MTLSVSSAGVTIETSDEIYDLMEAEAKSPSRFGPDFDMGEEEPARIHYQIIAEQLARCQAFLKAIYDSIGLNASGAAQDAIPGALLGITRQGATPSTVTLTLGGTPSTSIASGSLVRHNPTGTIWVTQSTVVIGGGGTITVVVNAQVTGPQQAAATSDWSPVTVIAGWTTATSAVDATPGRNAWGAATYRRTMVRKYKGAGKAAHGALEEALRDVANVTDVTVFNNDTDDEIDGMLPHSIHAIVDGGDQAEIAAALFDAKSAMTNTNGAIEETVVDLNGDDQIIRFDRRSTINFYVRVTFGNAQAEVALPTDYSDRIKNAIGALGSSYGLGRDVVPISLHGTVLEAFAQGTITSLVVEVSIDDSSWQSTPYVLGRAQVAAFAAARVSVVKT